MTRVNIGPPPIGEMGSYEITTISQYVSNYFSQKWLIGFLKLCMKLGNHKDKKFNESGVFEKKMPQNTPKIGLFGFCKKFSSLMCHFFYFKRCTIIALTILRKPHVWEKSGSGVIRLQTNQIAAFFKSEYF